MLTNSRDAEGEPKAEHLFIHQSTQKTREVLNNPPPHESSVGNGSFRWKIAATFRQ